MNIRVEHAECYSGCFDPDCPYTHTDLFYVWEEDTGREEGPFNTQTGSN